MKTLLSPLKIGRLEIKNRLIMAPLTRCRATSDARVPTDLMSQYYVQRAQAGLILSEATSVSPQGVGYPSTPGLWSKEQTEAWKKITHSVHNNNGILLAQLWHVGRVSDPTYLNGELPVAPSAVAPEGHVSLIRPQKAFVTPRALSLDEIKRTIDDYHTAAMNAKSAGFDGVEIHGANAYLPDQFLRDTTNFRIDEYGGSIENRMRFLLEITDAAISVFGADRVGVHLSPYGPGHTPADSNPVELFTQVSRQLSQRSIAFVCVREALGKELPIAPIIRKHFNGAFIANESYNFDSAEQAVATGAADAVAFGRLFIANPDLVHRYEVGASLNTPNPESFYSSGPVGYTDYPAL